MNERFFILDKFNTWYDWRCIVTAKSAQPPEPKTNYVEIEGASGALDFTEALTGEPVYSNRTMAASFICTEGTHREREALRRRITTALHGRLVKIIEPDDPDHFLLGRVRLTNFDNKPAYMSFDMEATCEPWRYAVNETTRRVPLVGPVDVVIRNEGDKTVIPVLTVAPRDMLGITSSVDLTFNGVTTKLPEGVYKVTGLRLVHGVNVVSLSGLGSIDITYREAVL